MTVKNKSTSNATRTSLYIKTSLLLWAKEANINLSKTLSNALAKKQGQTYYQVLNDHWNRQNYLTDTGDISFQAASPLAKQIWQAIDTHANERTCRNLYLQIKELGWQGIAIHSKKVKH